MNKAEALSEQEQGALNRELGLAARQGEARKVAQLLAAGGNPREVDDMGCNAFEWAARSENAETMELLAETCDVNRKNLNGWSPLAEAIIMRKSVETLRLLLSWSDLGMKHKALGHDFEAGFQEFAKLAGNQLAAEEVVREELRRAALAERGMIEENLQKIQADPAAARRTPRM